jgi:hypothetical protein
LKIAAGLTGLQSLERCYVLDETLARLARLYPDTKFLRARAAALGFTSAGAMSAPKSRPAPRQMKTLSENDEDDPYGSDSGSKEEEGDIVDEDDIDLDMLPTLLVYRDGELVFNWVRVDWEAGIAGIEELLDK